MAITRVNNEIREKAVLLVSEEGTQEISLKGALSKAQEMELDLVQVGSNNGHAVCKIMNYSKYLYEQKKKSKNNAKKVKLKEIKLRDGIAEHDEKVKAKAAQEMLNDGCMVKVSIRYSGRMINFVKRGVGILEGFTEYLETYTLEKKPVIEGGNVYMVLKPGKNK